MSSKDRSILIIDDDSRNIFALAAVLRARGYKTSAAKGMQEAFAVLKKDSSIAVILLDMMMPGMDGYAALQTLKADALLRRLPVIAVTAQAMAGDQEKCLAAGADDYLSKPVDVDKLVWLLKERL